jgi:hypothetical protein
MIEHGLVARPLLPCPGMPLGHVACLGGVEPEAEAEAGFPFLCQHAGDERLLASLQAHRVHVDES